MATTSNVQLVISAKDNASKTLKGIGTAVSGLGSAIGTVAKVGGAALLAVGATATAFGVSSVKAFAESEKEMAKFNATLGTLGKLGEKSRDEILKTSQAMIKLGFDDEQTANTLAMFTMRTKDVAKAQQLLQVSMDLSRAKSIDLDTASKMVNMTLSGNGKALKAYGIELKDGMDPLKALAELQKMVAGQAEAYAKTTTGSLEILNVSWGNLKETIGQVLVEKLKINEVMGFLIEKITAFGQLDFPGYWNTIANAITTTKDALFAWYEEFFKDTNYIWVFIKDFLIPIWEDLKLTAMTTFYAIRDAIKPIEPQLIMFAKVIGVILLGAIMAVIAIVAGLAKAFMYAASIITIVFSSAVRALTWTFEKLFTMINNIINAWNKLAGLAKKGLTTVINFVSKKKDSDDGKAFGGGVSSGQSYIVGEHRPEVFVPSQSGNIKQLDQVGGGAISVNFNNVNVRNDSDLQMIIDTVKRTLDRESKLSKSGITI